MDERIQVAQRNQRARNGVSDSRVLDSEAILERAGKFAKEILKAGDILETDKLSMKEITRKVATEAAQSQQGRIVMRMVAEWDIKRAQDNDKAFAPNQTITGAVKTLAKTKSKTAAANAPTTISKTAVATAPEKTTAAQVGTLSAITTAGQNTIDLGKLILEIGNASDVTTWAKKAAEELVNSILECDTRVQALEEATRRDAWKEAFGSLKKSWEIAKKKGLTSKMTEQSSRIKMPDERKY